MATLPDPLLNKCRKVLSSNSGYNTFESLQDLFSPSQELSNYKYFDRHNNPSRQIEHLVSYLLGVDTNEQGQLVFSIFLRHLLLSPRIPKEGQHYKNVRECYEEVEAHHFWSIENWEEMTNWKKLYNQDDVAALVKHLRECCSMSTRERRESVLEMLLKPPADTRIITSNGHHSEFTNSICLLKACPDYHHLEQLAYVIYQDEGETAEWKALDALLRNLHHVGATYTRLQQLQSILETLPLTKEILRDAYDDSMPKGSEAYKKFQTPVDDQSKLLTFMLDTLGKFRPQTDGTLPVIEFVRYFLSHIQHQQTTRNMLQEWCQNRASELGIQHYPWGTSNIKEPSRPSVPATYLLITVKALDKEEPIVKPEKKLEIRAWLMKEEEETKSYIHLEKKKPYSSIGPATTDFILKNIDEIRQRYAGYLSEELNIEVFLPNELLSYDIDQWEINVGMVKEKLGTEHKVVVRSLDRMNNIIIQTKWENKWKLYQAFLSGVKPQKGRGPVWSPTKEECEAQSFYSTLLKSQIVYVALTFALPPPQIIPIIRAILSAGIPIVLWPRQLKIPDQYNKFLSSADFTKLRNLVSDERFTAKDIGDADHHGHHLTLLWDDPHRVPPKRQLAHKSRKDVS